MNEQSTITVGLSGRNNQCVAVVGGGLAGLVASITAAKAGASVTLYEGAKSLGGRALTTENHGFYINMGPHALYVGGAGLQILRELGVDPKGAMPELNGTTAIFENKKYPLPFNFKSILFSPFLGLRDKFEVLRFYSKLPKMDASEYRDISQKAFVDALCSRPAARNFLNAMCRLGTYTNAPELLSAEVMIEQFRMGASGVLYLHKGWISMVNDLATIARDSGVTIVTGAKVKSVVQQSKGVAVSYGSASEELYDACILCVAPKSVAQLCQKERELEDTFEPAVEVRAACLDLALSEWPDQSATFALGMDEPSYFSLHSATADLAPPGGALVQAALYLGPEEKAGSDTRAVLEALVSKMQPGWQSKTVHAIYRPQALVSYRLPVAGNGGLKGRPDTRIADNLYIAGDWVGDTGLLTDAAVASAHKAAQQAVNALNLVPV